MEREAFLSWEAVIGFGIGHFGEIKVCHNY